MSIGVIAASFVASSTAYSAEVAADSPWGWWRPDSSSTKGVAADSSGNGNDFTYSIGVTARQAPLAPDGGYSVSGDGTTSVATIPIAAAMQGTAMSLECWVRLGTVPSTGAFMSVGTGGNGVSIGIGGTTMANSGSKLIILYGGINWTVTGYTFPAAGVYHVVFTRSGSSITVYVNGVSVHTQSITPTNGTGTVELGGISGGTPLPATHRLDNVAFFPSALSSARVAAHYNGGSFSESALLADAPWAYLKMDDPNTIADASGNNRPLAVAGAVTPDRVGPGSDSRSILWPAATRGRTGGLVDFRTGTVEMWVKLTANPAVSLPLWAFAPQDSGSSGVFGQGMITPAGLPTLTVYDGLSATYTSATALTLNVWHHLVFTIDATGSRIRQDGATTASGSKVAMASFGKYLWMHGANAAGGGASAGVAETAEMAYYTTALSDARTDAHLAAI